MESKYSWDALFKFAEFKDWILFYHNNTQYNFIQKKDMQAQDLVRLIEIANSYPNLKKELLK